MAMVTRIQADPFTQHFELQDFSFACLNTSGRCTLHVKGYRDDYIDTPTVVASWPGDVQHNTAMTRVHLPSEYTKLVEVEFIITDFAGSTFDPALLIDDVRHCNQLSSCVSLARARFTVQRMEMEIAHEWIHEMFDRRDKFFAHEHQHGQQHGGMEDKHSGGHGTEEL